jgi:hypothetical protein
MEDIIKFIILGALILFIIFAIVIPNLDSRASNPAAAISTLRTLSSAQELYNTRWKRYANLAELYRANMIGELLGKATNPEHAKSGYYFRMSLTEDSWSCVAIPVYPGSSGGRSFFIDETGEIREEPCMSKNDPRANKKSPTLEEASRKRAWEIELKNR